MDTQEQEQEREQEHESVEAVRGAIRQARTGVSDAVGHVPEVAASARHRAGQIAERLPGAVGRVGSSARSGVTGLQKMSDSRLRLMAAASIGFGAGLRLAGAPRLATVAGLVPASIFGFAIVSRPNRARPAPHQATS